MAFGGFNQQGGTPQMSEINMVPLIDVMLVLLIVFMITAPLLTHSVQIDLPKASSEATNQKPETVTLAMDGDGALYWNDQPIARTEVADRLREAAQQEPQPELHLRADRDTRYQVLAEVMAEARTAGIAKMGFITVPAR
ncbi:MAG: biopolymer transporter ExbD [Zoogloeaceae bacterium]|nr:biopolymer transporter ExbD [Zoogloeaceae bacterium]